MPVASEIWLEIGFGGGEHLAAQAARRPDVLFLGVEPFLNGVASALRHIDEGALGNVRLHVGDARDLMARLPNACLSRLFILFPDPWPKARHQKRRLVGAAFISEAARLLALGGRLRFATDWADYAEQVQGLFLTARQFEVMTQGDGAPADHVTTRYEEKRLGDCAPVWLDFKRLESEAGDADVRNATAPLSVAPGRPS